MRKDLIENIFQVRSAGDFDELALEVFQFQFGCNAVYRRFCLALGKDVASVKRIADIPFFPVELYKNHRVVSFSEEAAAIFKSSGTISAQAKPAVGNVKNGISPRSHTPAVYTGADMMRSKHFVKDLSIYHRSFTEGFRGLYGDPGAFCILSLLPSYLEQGDSSLVYMVKGLMELSAHPDNGFFLNDYKRLADTLLRLSKRAERVLLLGVSFALLDLAERYPGQLSNAIIMETGGMKGRRREMTREELHGRLMEAFGTGTIHSEYGMTELLSQAYSYGGGVFLCPPWMRVLIRDSNDPMQVTDGVRVGGINVIDLANLYSCSFLATQDLGRLKKDYGQTGSVDKQAFIISDAFEVIGRFDNSDVRGCNLMAVT